jgi:hypothetical protein
MLFGDSRRSKVAASAPSGEEEISTSARIAFSMTSTFPSLVDVRTCFKNQESRYRSSDTSRTESLIANTASTVDFWYAKLRSNPTAPFQTMLFGDSRRSKVAASAPSGEEEISASASIAFSMTSTFPSVVDVKTCFKN